MFKSSLGFDIIEVKLVFVIIELRARARVSEHEAPNFLVASA